MRAGSTVFIENIKDKINPLLYPIIKKGKHEKSATKFLEIVINDVLIQVNRNFTLIISSVETAPNFGAEIDEYISLVSFELTEPVFEAQILAVIIQETES